MLEFKLPEIGENIESGTVIKVSVNVGDSVKKDQSLLELETEKATLEVPSPCDGIIKEVLFKEGDEIKIGQLIMKIDKAASSVGPSTQKAAKKPAAPSAPAAPSTPATTAASAPAPATDASDDTKDYDCELLVIGGGPGGYAAAFLGADLGMKVTVIDEEKNPGGVCVYRGCIPSKALLHAAKVLAEAKDASEIGIEFSDPKIHVDKISQWKDSVISKLTGGAGQLSKARKINWIQGKAAFTNSGSVKVEKKSGGQQDLTFKQAILATGSHPISLPFAPKSDRILNSTTALELKDVPKKLLVIGGGYIGLELGTVYHELGSKVTVVEMLPHLLMGADRDLAVILEKRLQSRFEDIKLNTKVTKMDETSKGIKVTFEDKDGKTSTAEFDKVLISIGRKPNTQGIGLENTKIQLTDKGFVQVNAQRLTTDPRIYAIGDIAGDPMLAHKASHEGRVAVEAIAGHKVAFEPNAIPAVVYTDPEIAWCGITETQAKEENREVQILKFPWAASGRAITLNRTDGLTKLIVDPKTERVLGIGICGVGAGELIAEGVLAVEMGSVAADLKLSIHPHPTISETIMETAESFFGHSTHIYKPKKK